MTSCRLLFTLVAAASWSFASPAFAEVGPAHSTPAPLGPLPPAALPPPPAYAPPPAYYPYPPPQPYAPVVDPPPPVFKQRRSPEAMYGGIVLTGLGGVSVIVGGAVLLAAGATAWREAWDGCDARGCNKTASIGIGLMIGGLVGAAVGIPLIVYGAKKAPAKPSWAGAPGSAGWVWRF